MGSTPFHHSLCFFGQKLYETKKVADKMRLPFGFNLARDAYMWSESLFMNSVGVESPNHNSINNTHDW